MLAFFCMVGGLLTVVGVAVMGFAIWDYQGFVPLLLGGTLVILGIVVLGFGLYVF